MGQSPAAALGRGGCPRAAPPGPGCARRMRGRGAAAPAAPRWEREVSGAAARGLRAATGLPGAGRREGITAQLCGGRRGCSVKSRFLLRDGGCRGRWSGRAAGGAWRGGGAAHRRSGEYSQRWRFQPFLPQKRFQVPCAGGWSIGASLNVWRGEIRELCVC